MDYVTISRGFNLAEADMLVSRLRAAGYDVLLLGGDAGRMTASLMSVGGVRIQVPANQKDDVEKFIEAYEKEAAATSTESDEEADSSASDTPSAH